MKKDCRRLDHYEPGTPRRHHPHPDPPPSTGRNDLAICEYCNPASGARGGLIAGSARDDPALLLAGQRAEGYRRVQQGGTKIMPDDTHMDLSQRVTALEQMLAECRAER